MHTWPLIIVLLVLIFSWLISIYRKRARIANMLKGVPGPFALPFVGSLYLWKYISKTDYLGSVQEFCQSYGPHIVGWVGNTPAVVISDPVDTKIIYNSVSKTRKDGYTIYDVKRLTGNGLITANHEVWKTERKILNKLFKSHRLDEYVTLFQKHAEKLVETLRLQNTPDIDLWCTFNQCALSVVYDTLIGPVTAGNQHVVNKLGIWLARLGELAGMRMAYPVLRIEFIFNYLTPWGKEFQTLLSNFKSFIAKVVERQKEQFNEKQFDEDTCTIAEILLKECSSTQQIEDEIATISAASSDTTGTVMSFAMILLGMHPDKQEKVYNEVIDVLGSTEGVNSENIKSLKYTEMVIWETMRIFPIIPFVSRVPLTDLKLSSFTVPANSLIILNFLSMHRSKEYWHNPLSFKPERFATKNGEKHEQNAFFPFGAGPRLCIGQKFAIMELKTLLANVVRRYEISTNYKSINDVKLMYGVIIRSMNGSQCVLKERFRSEARGA